MCVHVWRTTQELGGHVYFAHFETRKMQKFLENMRERGVVDASTVVYGTGGGARKYAGKIKELLDVSDDVLSVFLPLVLNILSPAVMLSLMSQPCVECVSAIGLWCVKSIGQLH